MLWSVDQSPCHLAVFFQRCSRKGQAQMLRGPYPTDPSEHTMPTISINIFFRKHQSQPSFKWLYALTLQQRKCSNTNLAMINIEDPRRYLVMRVPRLEAVEFGLNLAEGCSPIHQAGLKQGRVRAKLDGQLPAPENRFATRNRVNGGIQKICTNPPPVKEVPLPSLDLQPQPTDSPCNDFLTLAQYRLHQAEVLQSR